MPPQETLYAQHVHTKRLLQQTTRITQIPLIAPNTVLHQAALNFTQKTITANNLYTTKVLHQGPLLAIQQELLPNYRPNCCACLHTRYWLTYTDMTFRKNQGSRRFVVPKSRAPNQFQAMLLYSWTKDPYS